MLCYARRATISRRAGGALLRELLASDERSLEANLRHRREYAAVLANGIILHNLTYPPPHHRYAALAKWSALGVRRHVKLLLSCALRLRELRDKRAAMDWLRAHARARALRTRMRRSTERVARGSDGGRGEPWSAPRRAAPRARKQLNMELPPCTPLLPHARRCIAGGVLSATQLHPPAWHAANDAATRVT
jgi:hypothetical protein